ncbi:NAD(P)/FAD-dependent oxidoreductase [Aestuariicella hydrocarbonica]|uniref:Pyridine nucleotide-disulfide oxidoreductase domain-containing protein 2 n=1 Tax=Pseudomaricurvus hydrocarbonicus TaxID=1470433 RepID=A0A9E5MI16_9GAMM|nr:NAD(P)/FAD-dependent oxidoreductase [Aestuariicella hydrocarbonica]NHO66711.1 NAD(P)/FAD-dependent oxidoreductase [Aestuariicella hydrocarbonica]
MSSVSEYDVAVVGGGHNGLTAACYLAKAGKKVVVIEALDSVGGMCVSGPLIEEAPNHTIHPCSLDLMSLRVHPLVPDELDLHSLGFRQEELSPGYVYCHPDGNSLVIFRDPEDTAREIARYSQHDADEFLKLMKVIYAFIDMAVPMMRVDPSQLNFGAKLNALKTLIKNFRIKPEIMALIGSPAYTSIMERFEHPIVQSALCCLLGAAGPITNEATGVYFALLGFLHKYGVGRAIGGMQTISDALSARLQQLGGEVILNAPVAEIVSSNRQVSAVRLKDGRVIQVKAVVASIHPKQALEMVTEGELDRTTLTRVAMAPANAHGGSPIKVDLALNDQVNYRRIESMRPDGLSLRKCVLLIGTTEAVLDNFKCAARGEVSKMPYLWMCVPSAADPGQAPIGQDVAYLYPVAMPVDHNEGWDNVRDQVGQQVIDWAAEYMGGLKDFEIGRQMEVARDWEARLNVHNGCVVHIDTSTTRSSGMRPAAGLGGDTLPVAGLFLGGAGTHPGGGVNGMPGRIAAGRVKRYLR